jgi:hypothetical protein
MSTTVAPEFESLAEDAYPHGLRGRSTITPLSDRFADGHAGVLHVDDELAVYARHERPSDPDEAANWLPAEGAFRLTPRFYGPRWSPIDGSDDGPRVVPAEE